MTVRRALLTSALASALSVTGVLPLGGFVSLARAHARAHVPAAAECQPEDQACKDREANEEQAKEIDEQQKKTQAAADKAGKDIDETGKKIQECQPGSSDCMEKLAGKGEREEGGITDMTNTIDTYRPEPADNAKEAVESTCEGFPASLPEGSTDAGSSPFPVSQLCALLGP
ncbi:hypothetical protein ACFU5O_30690 [Streptomyces sp. NPDC057445]|uniref:hypothetical protein n=1 Tax=Streptomyces sp. NPDC057445 TaxID=3346136 RepID=UPI0036AA37BC